ncbi:S-crystallin SL11-like [Watersipora subatra]|uniref:S-crystallin SL11-like n=1 Tax=Watersipora subatra TaxID=2589382 RepID=UPI00355AF1DF
MTAEISTRQEVKLHSVPQETSNINSPVIMGMGEKKTYTLTYFDIRGRAEPIRLLFALAGVTYNDRRIDVNEWMEMKSTTPFGQLPILEISGGGFKSPQKLNQSHSIMRHLAREFGLDGRSSMEKTKVDIISETMRESIEPIAQIFNETDEGVKDKVMSRYREDLLPRFLDYLTDNLNEEWFLDQISLADILIYVALENMTMFLPDLLDGKSYWKLRDWRTRFESHSKIAEWLANRPITSR